MKSSQFLALISLISPSLTSAAVFQVDFGRTDNTTIITGYNNVGAGSATTEQPEPVVLTDDTGAVSGITLTMDMSSGGTWAGSGADYTGPFPDAISSQPASALQDGLNLVGDNRPVITLSGLDPATTYDLVLYAARGNNGGELNYTVTDGSGPATLIIADVLNNSTLTANITELLPNDAGVITIEVFKAAISGRGGINYLQLTSGDSTPPTFTILNSGENLDFSWTSTSGRQYDLLSAPDLSSDPSTWLPYDDGVTVHEDIPASGTGMNILTGVLRPDSRRFFVLREEPLPLGALLSAGFESGDEGFVATNNLAGSTWEVGDPDSTGAGGSVLTGSSSVICWGVGIGNPGVFAPLTSTSLRSPLIDLSTLTNATLSFDEALDLGPNDVAEVYVIDDENNRIGDAIYTAADEDTTSADWNTTSEISLPAGAFGQSVRLEFLFEQVQNTEARLGWYIDNVLLEGR